MKLLTPGEMRSIDQKMIEELKVPGLLLMEHAAYGIFTHLMSRTISGQVVIICGPGNNGGDGLALARQLEVFSALKVKVIILAEVNQLGSDGKVYYDICDKLQIECLHVTKENKQIAIEIIKEAGTIVDAIFGTGLSRAIEGIYKEIIESINQSKAYIVSVDIPSGIDGKTGKILGIAVKADTTITFVLPKIGLYQYPAVDYTGNVEVVQIGVAESILEEIEVNTFSIEKEDMIKLMPKRYTRSNKGSYGKVLVIGGQKGMSGAPTLASLGALKVGCGTVTVAVPESIHDIMECKLTEAMTVAIPDLEGHFSERSIKPIETLCKRYDTFIVGPGMGRDKSSLEILLPILVSEKACILDADALYFLPEVLSLARVRRIPLVITPHPGEMARLIGISIEEVLESPIQIAQQFAMENNIITVLKIERTVIADTKGNIYINRRGNSGMAKGGSGDVLAGIIGGLLGQHIDPLSAAQLGCYIHSSSGDYAKEEKSEYNFLPTDLLEYLPRVFNEMV